MIFAICIGLLTIPQSFALNKCSGKQFGYKVADARDPHAYDVCLGVLGNINYICEHEYWFSESDQQCKIEMPAEFTKNLETKPDTNEKTSMEPSIFEMFERLLNWPEEPTKNVKKSSAKPVKTLENPLSMSRRSSIAQPIIDAFSLSQSSSPAVPESSDSILKDDASAPESSSSTVDASSPSPFSSPAVLESSDSIFKDDASTPESSSSTVDASSPGPSSSSAVLESSDSIFKDDASTPESSSSTVDASNPSPSSSPAVLESSDSIFNDDASTPESSSSTVDVSSPSPSSSPVVLESSDSIFNDDASTSENSSSTVDASSPGPSSSSGLPESNESTKKDDDSDAYNDENTTSNQNTTNEPLIEC